MPASPAYDHVQRGKIHYILYAMVLPLAALALRMDPVWAPLPLAGAGVLGLFAMGFHRLRVRDAGDRLALSFGPLPFLRKSIPYAAMTDVTAGRTSLLDGWGVHWFPFRGSTWNIWGRDCARLELGRKTLRVGTDDPHGLVAFLRTRVG